MKRKPFNIQTEQLYATKPEEKERIFTGKVVRIDEKHLPTSAALWMQGYNLKFHIVINIGSVDVETDVFSKEIGIPKIDNLITIKETLKRNNATLFYFYIFEVKKPTPLEVIMFRKTIRL